MSKIVVSVCGDPIDMESLTNWNETPAPGVDEEHIYRCVCGAYTFETQHAYLGAGFNFFPGVKLTCPCCGSTIELRRRDFDGTELLGFIDKDKERRFTNRRMKRILQRRGTIRPEYRAKSADSRYDGLEVLEILDRALNHKPLEGESSTHDHELYEDIKELLLENLNKELYDRTQRNVFLGEEN